MFGRKARRIAELEEACAQWARDCDAYAENNDKLAKRTLEAEAEVERLKRHDTRLAFADRAQDVLAAFGANGEVNELALRNALDVLDGETLTSLNVRMQVAAARLNDEAARRG